MERPDLDASEALRGHEVLRQGRGKRGPVRGVVVEVAGAHDQVRGVGRLEKQAAARSQRPFRRFQQRQQVLGVQVLDDVEGRDHVDGVRRQCLQVAEGVADLHVQPTRATRGHEVGVGVDAPGCHARSAEQRQPLSSTAAQVHDAAGAGEPVHVGQVALQLGADLGGRAAEVLGEVGVDRREARTPSVAVVAAPATRLQTPQLGLHRLQSVLVVPNQAAQLVDGMAEARQLALEVHPTRLRRGSVSSGARAHPAPTLPASPASGSAGAAAGASGLGIWRSTFTGLPATTV